MDSKDCDEGGGRIKKLKNIKHTLTDCDNIMDSSVNIHFVMRKDGEERCEWSEVDKGLSGVVTKNKGIELKILSSHTIFLRSCSISCLIRFLMFPKSLYAFLLNWENLQRTFTLRSFSALSSFRHGFFEIRFFCF